MVHINYHSLYTKVQKKIIQIRSNGVFFVFDITKEESLQNVLKQYNEVNDKFASNCQIVLVGNKVDLESEYTLHIICYSGKISTLEVKAFADQQKMQYIEVSEKTDYNLNQLFESTATEILDKVDKKQIDLEKDVIKIGNYQEQNNISTENN
ncbi:unnamed protein product [Paramecium sonneborni]|uniref:Uncharacterized protein n=1 Tax=Paramecium sonneborni TaxID=65129 RepID=A0A8S1RS54_9CILI|nr:unnamed protein product [Paramecium sonneborni]